MTVAYPALVRRATPEDIGALLQLVPPVIEEATLLPISLGKIEALIEKCAFQQSGAIAGIIDGPDGVAAGIGLAFCEAETSDVPYLRAIWCGLSPASRKHPRKNKSEADPRLHYGRSLFEFARWCHEGLEKQAGHNILLQFDIATRVLLAAKMRLYERHLTQVGATYAFGATGEFVTQKLEVEAA